MVFVIPSALLTIPRISSNSFCSRAFRSSFHRRRAQLRDKDRCGDILEPTGHRDNIIGCRTHSILTFSFVVRSIISDSRGLATTLVVVPEPILLSVVSVVSVVMRMPSAGYSIVGVVIVSRLTSADTRTTALPGPRTVVGMFSTFLLR